MSKKKILMLSFRLPFPLSEGFKLRTYHIAKTLAQEYEVDLLTLHNGSVRREYLTKLKEIFGQIVVYPIYPASAKLHALRALPTDTPLQVLYHRSRSAQEWVDKHYERYDLFFCVHLRMAQYLEGIPSRKVIDLIDATSLLYRGAYEHATGLWKCIYGLESRRLLAYELKVLKAFDRAFVTSRYDAAYLARHLPFSRPLLDSRLVVIPNGVREELLHRSDRDEDMKEENWLLFLGKMDYAPNVDAVLHFCKHAWPKLRSADKTLKFLIVGTSPRPKVQALRRLPGVEVTGFLENPFTHMKRAKVIVVPLRYSTGIQNKILEAMALGKPVVTTAPGARGIEGVTGKHFQVIREQDFIPEILALLKDGVKRKYLGENAKELVRARYRWDLVGKRLLEEIEEPPSRRFGTCGRVKERETRRRRDVPSLSR